MRLGYVLALVWSVAATLSAQGPDGFPVPTHVTVYVVPADNPTSPPIREANYPIDGLCGLAAPTLPTAPIVNPPATVWRDPYVADKYCRALLPEGIPEGMAYRSLIVYTATPCTAAVNPSCVSERVAEAVSLDEFAVQAGQDCTGQVVLDIGDWTRSVPAKGYARVQFSLTRSVGAVTAIRLSARPQGGTFTPTSQPIVGSDLKWISGAYFQLPTTPGKYDLQVVAETSAGCTDGSDRPMSTTVK